MAAVSDPGALNSPTRGVGIHQVIIKWASSLGCKLSVGCAHTGVRPDRARVFEAMLHDSCRCIQERALGHKQLRYGSCRIPAPVVRLHISSFAAALLYATPIRLSTVNARSRIARRSDG